MGKKLLIVLVLSLIVAACGDSFSDTKTVDSGQQNESQNESQDESQDTRIATNLIESQLEALYIVEKTEMADDSYSIARRMGSLFVSTDHIRLQHENLIDHVEFFLNDAIQYIEQVSNKNSINKDEVKQLVTKYKYLFIAHYRDLLAEFNIEDLIILDQPRLDNEFLIIFNKIELL